jgi:hypothetical protein
LKIVNCGKRFYAAFIDMKKCFDSVYRNALWLKIYKLEVNGKMLRIVRSMYDQVRCRVKHLNKYPEFMEILVG